MDASGNLYIADSCNGSDPQGDGGDRHHHDGGRATAQRAIRRRRPGHQRRAQLPWGVAVDSAGNLYIADTSNNAIRKVTAATGTITTVAGNGQSAIRATAARHERHNSPDGVAVDAAGNVYIADHATT